MIEPKIYRTRREHINQYTIDKVSVKRKLIRHRKSILDMGKTFKKWRINCCSSSTGAITQGQH